MFYSNTLLCVVTKYYLKCGAKINKLFVFASIFAEYFRPEGTRNHKISTQHYFIVNFWHLPIQKEHTAVVQIETDDYLVERDELLPERQGSSVGMDAFDDVSAVDRLFMLQKIVEPGVETQQPTVGGREGTGERLGHLRRLPVRAHHFRNETVGKGRLNAKAMATRPA